MALRSIYGTFTIKAAGMGFIMKSPVGLTGLLYVPFDKSNRVKPGMSVLFAPNIIEVADSGSLTGVVRK